MGYRSLYENIDLALRERGQVVVSSSWDNLDRGADCLRGQIELYPVRLVHVKKLKNGCNVYQLRRKNNG